MKVGQQTLRVAAGAVGVTLLLAASCFAQGNRPRAGEVLQNFAFTGLDGKTYHLSDLDGRYVLMEFWATWCEPCVHEIPVLKKARELYGKRGLEILGLNSDRSPEKARKFVAENQIPWLQVAPQSTKALIKHRLKVRWYPTIILLNPQHRVLLVLGNGKAFLPGAKLLKELNRLLPSGSSSRR